MPATAVPVHECRLYLKGFNTPQILILARYTPNSGIRVFLSLHAVDMPVGSGSIKMHATAYNRVITLSNGVELPRIGLGTFRSQGAEVKLATRCALQNGIKHIDTAAIYKVLYRLLLAYFNAQ